MGVPIPVLHHVTDIATISLLEITIVTLAAVIVTAWARSTFTAPDCTSRFPTINYQKSEWTYFKAKKEYLFNARDLIASGFQKFSGPFNLVTQIGPVILLPPDMIDDVNKEPKLNFNAFTKEEHLADFDTFRTFRATHEGLFESAVMKGLTRSLPKFTKPLSDEMTECLDETWGQDTDWHTIDLRSDVLSWVARLSTRIFVGKRLSRDKEWLRISIDFTVDCFTGMAICKLFPGFMRRFAAWLLPVCRKARRDYQSALKIFQPIFKERHDEIAAAHREGRSPDLPDDSIEWFRNAANGRQYNEMDLQLGLAVAAVHTTSDLLCQSLLNLCSHPELFEPLRTEAVEVLRKYGWQKVALTELRLMDSFFKETQRLKPIAMTTMHRSATADVELSNGVKIKQGERIAISSHRMWSTEHYSDPSKFDAYRFMERRKIPGLENRSLFVSTSTDHTAFSHGKHACPGRFFAANEVKIAMLHLLLKYDFAIVDAQQVKWNEYGENMFASTKAQLKVRRRRAEIDLDGISANV